MRAIHAIHLHITRAESRRSVTRSAIFARIFAKLPISGRGLNAVRTESTNDSGLKVAGVNFGNYPSNISVVGARDCGFVRNRFVVHGWVCEMRCAHALVTVMCVMGLLFLASSMQLFQLESGFWLLLIILCVYGSTFFINLSSLNRCSLAHSFSRSGHICPAQTLFHTFTVAHLVLVN